MTRFMYYTQEFDDMLNRVIERADSRRNKTLSHTLLLQIYWLSYKSAWIGGINRRVCSNRVLGEICGVKHTTIKDCTDFLDNEGYIRRKIVVYPTSAWSPNRPHFLSWQFSGDCGVLGEKGIKRDAQRPETVELEQLTEEQRAVVPEGEQGPFFVVEYIYPVRWDELFCVNGMAGKGFQRPQTWDSDEPIVYRSGYRETYQDKALDLGTAERKDVFTDEGKIKFVVVTSVLHNATSVFTEKSYRGYLDRLDDEDEYALRGIMTPLLEEATKEETGWSIKTYFEWVQRFGVNPEHAAPSSIYDYFTERSVKCFLRYMKAEHSGLRAYQHETELIEAYYETFPTDFKFKIGGYEKVLEVVRGWLKAGYEWYLLPQIFERGAKRSTPEKPVNVWDFEIGHMRSKLRVDPKNLSPDIVSEGKKWAGIDTAAWDVPEDFKTELWLLAEYRKRGDEVFKDKKWTEKDEDYGYAKYLK